MNAPCHATPATPLFDREAWSQHPNFPSNLLLLGSHENFRKVSKTLVARADGLEADPNSDWRDDTLYLFSWWQGGMKSHEHYEERKLYPYLAARYCVTLETLVGDHGELDVLRGRVTRALMSGAAADAQSALRRFDQVLVRHLRHEEDLVIPMLLELEPQEFARYTASPPDARACEGCA